jgi:HPt (histidine-containing phosphotransfer) domain-containing protein
MDSQNVNINALFERTAGDTDLVMELLSLIDIEKVNYHNNMLDSLKNSDYLSLASEAHKMKSAVAVLGFDKLASKVVELEKNANKKNDKYDYANEINCIFMLLNDSVNELENYLKK